MARIEGYEKVAQLMHYRPELAIVRSFSELNLRNILYLQAELTQLEHELRLTTNADILSNDAVRQYHARHWPLLSDSQNLGNNAQIKKILEVREKLGEYSMIHPGQLAAGFCGAFQLR